MANSRALKVAMRLLLRIVTARCRQNFVAYGTKFCTSSARRIRLVHFAGIRSALWPCLAPNSAYSFLMSANELLEKVRRLPARERRKFFEGVYELENGLAPSAPKRRQARLRWPDAAARRRKIFGDKVLPNLVLLAREEERY